MGVAKGWCWVWPMGAVGGGVASGGCWLGGASGRGWTRCGQWVVLGWVRSVGGSVHRLGVSRKGKGRLFLSFLRYPFCSTVCFLGVSSHYPA